MATIGISAGGRPFMTLRRTLEKCDALAALLPNLPIDPRNGLPFLDVDPKVFAHVLHYLRTGDQSRPRSDLVARGMHMQLKEWKLVPHSTNNNDKNGVVFPNVLVCQLSDQFQQDAGVKRHGITVTYGADGFELGRLARRVRKDLKTMLASTYWQMHRTHERAAFFQCTKVPNGTADLLLTTLTQHVVGHTERRGYVLDNSYVTMTPDPGHIHVRMIMHVLIFKRRRAVDPGVDLDEDAEDAALSLAESPTTTSPSMMPSVGPTPPKVIAQRLEKIWPDLA